MTFGVLLLKFGVVAVDIFGLLNASLCVWMAYQGGRFWYRTRALKRDKQAEIKKTACALRWRTVVYSMDFIDAIQPEIYGGTRRIVQAPPYRNCHWKDENPKPTTRWKRYLYNLTEIYREPRKTYAGEQFRIDVKMAYKLIKKRVPLVFVSDIGT